MSFIASMVTAAAGGGLLGAAAGASASAVAGAGLGAGVSALTGGDVGEGALMGGIGGLGAGAGAILGGATMGAEAIGEGAAASGAGSAGAGAGAGAGAAPVVENAGLQSSGVVTQGLGANTAPITGEVTSGSLTAPTANTGMAALPEPIAQGNGVVTQGLGAQTPPPMSHPLPGSQPLNVLAEAPQNSDVLLNGSTGPGWGQQLLNKAGIESQAGSKIGGQALENAVYGAGINGLLAGAQGQDVGKAMGIGALSGGIGGAAGAGLSEAPGAVGEFAAAHPMITSGAIGMGANTALNGLTASNPSAPDYKGIRSNVKWNPNVYKPYGPQFAAGGITDLDNYDAAPNQPITAPPGTLNIPNRAEVANNEGYVGDSVQLMAHGGISDLGGYSDGGRLLKGPGTGVSDDIPATIEGKQPARLAANEFVIPSRIVSEIGNGSTDAGAKALYAMMDRVQNDRKKSIGKGKFAVDSKAARHLDAL